MLLITFVNYKTNNQWLHSPLKYILIPHDSCDSCSVQDLELMFMEALNKTKSLYFNTYLTLI